MPHVGKTIPRLFKNYLNFLSSPQTSGPCRKFNLRQFVGTPSGTLAALWGGVDMVSEVGDYWPDDNRQTFYHFVCPNDSLMFMDMRFDLVEKTDPHLSNPAYEYIVTAEVWREGELIASSDFLGRVGEVFARFGTGNQIWGPGWDYDVGFPRWVSCRIDTRAANWAEQPDYHPYRYDP